MKTFISQNGSVGLKIVIDVDEYEHLKLAASKLAESEKIIKEHLKIKEQHYPLPEQSGFDNISITTLPPHPQGEKITAILRAAHGSLDKKIWMVFDQL